MTSERLQRLEAMKQPLVDKLNALASVQDARWWLDYRHNDFVNMQPEFLTDLL